MSIIVENPITQELLTNCSFKIQNYSHQSAELVTKIGNQNQTITLLGLILFVSFLLLFFVSLYFLARKFWAYRLGIIKNGSISYEYKFHIGKEYIKDKNTYIITPRMIFGKYLLWYFQNPRGIIFNEAENQPTLQDLQYSNLNKSKIIEKFLTAEDFMNLIKILLIVIIVLGLLCLVFDYFINNKDMVCNLVVENKTILTNLMKNGK